MPVCECVRKFWYSVEAQDLIEYTLIIAAIALVFFGVLNMLEPNMKHIWTASNSNLSTAGSVALAGSS